MGGRLLEELIVRYKVDKSDLSTGLKQVKQEMSGLREETQHSTSAFKNLFSGAVSMAAGIGIAHLAGDAFGFLKDQVKGVFEESLDAQQGLAQTNAVIKSTHDVSGMTSSAVVDLAGELSHLTRFSDDTVQSAENMLLTFTNIGKNVFPQATKTVLDMSQALGQDTKSSAIQLGKALNDPITGITALQRVGVTFTDKQKEVIKKMVDTGNVAGAQKVILAELTREFGDTAEAAGRTLPGQLDILKQNFADFKQMIGDIVIPKLTDLVTTINNKLMPKLNEFSDWFTKNAVPKIQKFVDVVSKNAPIAFNILKESAHTAIDGLKSVFDTIEPILGPPLKKIGDIIGGALLDDFDFALKEGKQLSTWFGTDMVSALQKAAPGFAHFGDVLLNTVAPALAYAWSKGQDLERTVAAVFIPIFEKATPLLVQFGGAIYDKLGSALQFVTPYFNSAVEAIDHFGQQLGGRALEAVDFFFQELQIALPAFQAVWDSTWAVVGNQLAGAWGVMSGVVQVAWSVLSGIVLTGLDVLEGHWGAVWDDIKDSLAGTWNGIRDIIAGFLKFINIDIGNFGKIATGHMTDMKKGVSDQANQADKNVTASFKDMNWWGAKNTGELTGTAKRLFKEMVGGLDSSMSQLDQDTKDYWNDIAAYIDNKSGLAAQAAQRNFDSIHMPNLSGNFIHLNDPGTTAGGNAEGTDDWRGGLTWVGERGKELIDAPRHSKIYDHATSMRMASGSSGGSGSSAGGSSGRVQNITLEIDGRVIARVVNVHTDRDVRMKLGGQGRAA